MAEEKLYRVRVPFWGYELFEVCAESEEDALGKVDDTKYKALETVVEEYDPREFWFVEYLGTVNLDAETEKEHDLELNDPDEIIKL